MLTLDEALAHAATCTGESRTHEALRVLAAEFAKSTPYGGEVELTINHNQFYTTKYGSCPTCQGKTIDGICTRCGL